MGCLHRVTLPHEACIQKLTWLIRLTIWGPRHILVIASDSFVFSNPDQNCAPLGTNNYIVTKCGPSLAGQPFQVVFDLCNGTCLVLFGTERGFCPWRPWRDWKTGQPVRIMIDECLFIFWLWNTLSVRGLRRIAVEQSSGEVKLHYLLLIYFGLQYLVIAVIVFALAVPLCA